MSAETDRLMKASATTVFCVSAGIILGHGALVRARTGHPDEARALARVIDGIAYERVVPASLKAMGLAFTGDRVEIDAAPRNVTMRLPFLAVAAVATRQHAQALAVADLLDADAKGGARFYAAVAEAVREEVARDRGGAAPRHARLKEIGYLGWSEVLSARAGA